MLIAITLAHASLLGSERPRLLLLDEVAAVPEDLRMFIGNAIRALVTELRFQDALPGYLLPDAASQSRIPLLLRRLESLAKL